MQVLVFYLVLLDNAVGLQDGMLLDFDHLMH